MAGIKTHCRRGHPFTPRNVRLRRYKDREIRGCRLCENANARRKYREEGYKTHTKHGRGEPDMRFKNQRITTKKASQDETITSNCNDDRTGIKCCGA